MKKEKNKVDEGRRSASSCKSKSIIEFWERIIKKNIYIERSGVGGVFLLK
jgi:hypothetical protein